MDFVCRLQKMLQKFDFFGEVVYNHGYRKIGDKKGEPPERKGDSNGR